MPLPVARQVHPDPEQARTLAVPCAAEPLGPALSRHVPRPPPARNLPAGAGRPHSGT
ncbi:hypothetical protein [Streptomyces sp. NPDC001851]|uniref:hypothetical protein n=1 Tax=Streptomyces sp. NPDC001851 TaxID=3154529 RepID=UPI0033252A91